MKSILSIMLLVTSLLVGCGKNEDDTFSTNAPENGEVETQLPASSDPLPANSLESELTRSLDDNSIIDVVLKASKQYAPILYSDAWIYFEAASEVELPEHAFMISGRPGAQLLTLRITRSATTDSLPLNIKCIYLGQGTGNATEYTLAITSYRFDFCVNESVSVSTSNRNSVRISSQNIFNSTKRSLQKINVRRGDKLSVHIENGNPTQSPSLTNITTKVELKFKVFE